MLSPHMAEREGRRTEGRGRGEKKMGEREGEKNLVNAGVFSYKGINRIMRNTLTLMASAKPNYLPKASSPHTVTLGVRVRSST